MVKSLYNKVRKKLYSWLTHEPLSHDPLPYDFSRLRYEIRPGDVLLIEGRSRISKIIRWVTQSPWTHAALYIGRLNDFEDEKIAALIRPHTDAKENVRLIVEDMLDKGTVVMPLNTYRHHHIRICRPIGITPADVELVIRYAIKSLGQPYNVRQLFDLGRFLLPWTILPRRWGSSLFRTASGEPESGICSSLIAEAFSSVQFPVLPFVKMNGTMETAKTESETVDSEAAIDVNINTTDIEVFQRNPYLFTPKDFDYSPYFNIIKYPLFNPDEPLPYYRRLPWDQTGRLYQDHGTWSKAHKHAAEAKSDAEKPPQPDPSPSKEEKN
jgi:hypothetical protein